MCVFLVIIRIIHILDLPKKFGIISFIWAGILASANFLDNEPVQDRRLGACGLALHYANIINQIDNIVSITAAV